MSNKIGKREQRLKQAFEAQISRFADMIDKANNRLESADKEMELTKVYAENQINKITTERNNRLKELVGLINELHHEINKLEEEKAETITEYNEFISTLE